MARNQVGKRRLCAESLESRDLLAGDVTLRVIGGNLFMTGDGANNAATLAGTATPGKFIVTGAAGTKIDGKAAETVTGVNASVIVSLDGGNDTLTVSKAHINGSLSIDTGGGTDAVFMGNDPHDNGGDGTPPASSLVSIGGSLVVNLGSGAGSQFVADNVSVAGSMVVQHGSGKVAGAGIEVENSNVAGVLEIINGGGGTVNIEGDKATQLVFVDTGNSNDTFNLGDTGPLKNTFKVVQISLGGGNDTLNVINTTVTLATVFDGGTGTNKYKDNGGNHLSNLTKVNFA